MGEGGGGSGCKSMEKEEKIESAERTPLARRGPCSVCIPTVMIVGAEEAYCPPRIVLPIQGPSEMDGREEGKGQKEG